MPTRPKNTPNQTTPKKTTRGKSATGVKSSQEAKTFELFKKLSNLKRLNEWRIEKLLDGDIHALEELLGTIKSKVERGTAETITVEKDTVLDLRDIGEICLSDAKVFQHVLEGNCYYIKGKHQEALKFYNRAIETNFGGNVWIKLSFDKENESLEMDKNGEGVIKKHIEHEIIRDIYGENVLELTTLRNLGSMLLCFSGVKNYAFYGYNYGKINIRAEIEKCKNKCKDEDENLRKELLAYSEDLRRQEIDALREKIISKQKDCLNENSFEDDYRKNLCRDNSGNDKHSGASSSIVSFSPSCKRIFFACPKQTEYSRR
jgi:tetratricopeptide (TPR) repeat protein